MAKKIYPLAILGTGMAGLTASLYASRYQMEHILIGEVVGGNALESILVENYPGFKKITGAKLVNNLKKQVLVYKPVWEQAKIKTVLKTAKYFLIKTDTRKEFMADYLLFALGTKRRLLGAKGEKRFLGKGVHYCPTCDGYFYLNKTIAVVGAGDSGVMAALYLADLAKKIYLLDINKKIKAVPFLRKKLFSKKNIKLMLGFVVKAFKGKTKLSEIELESLDGKKEKLKVDAVFIEIGGFPNTKMLKQLGVKIDPEGYIKTKSNMQTSNTHIFAAGDLTTGSNYFAQMITAAAEGAIAINAIYQKWQKE